MNVPAHGTRYHGEKPPRAAWACAPYRHVLAAAAITPSMSRVGDCWDNAVVESFFATLTKELLVHGLFESRATAARELFAFIEIWYNRQRQHSSLDYRSPAQFEAELQAALPKVS